MERIQIVDPLIGEDMTAVRAVELALSKQWSHVIFESNSKLLCSNVSQSLLSTSWEIKERILSIRVAFKGQSAWAMHWVPRGFNQKAHLLAQGAAQAKLFGFIDLSSIPLFSVLCDTNSLLL